MGKRALVLIVLFITALCISLPYGFGQAQVTGAIQGTVTDPSGAILAGAALSLKSVATGATQTGKSDSQGEFRFALLPPGVYDLTVTAAGFRTIDTHITVTVAQVTPVNYKMTLASASQTVEVASAETPLLQTENGNTVASLTPEQVENIPVPGRDLNYIALLTPGAVMVGGSSFPSVYGMPTSANMITVNGMEDIDPWNNGTNGGASNLLLGENEVQEATVSSNDYNGNYGILGGSNVNMVTKSGTNQFHGDAIWNWAGRASEANNFFRNGLGETRPFVNSNQWAASIGGPIIKNKLFFFADSEGIYLVLPGSQTPVNVPTPAFETATIANLTTQFGATSPTVTFYQQMFKLYNNAPGASTAGPTPGGGCGAFTPPAGVTACSNQFYSAQTNTSHEHILTLRTDYNLDTTDHIYFHYLLDQGLQDTGVDPINPVFSANSNQPEFNMQLSWTHTFGAAAVNQLQAGGQNYKALFGPANLSAALATFPTTLSFADGSFTTLGGGDSGYPTGRDVTRYQIADDYSHIWGAHSVGVGMYFSRYDATDFQLGSGTSGSLTAETLDAFYNGGFDPATPSTNYSLYTQSYPNQLQVPLAMYRLGFYGQDEWRVTPTFSLNFSLRFDHPSNPVCQTKCYAVTAGWYNIDHGVGTAYNATITAGQLQALPGLQTLEVQPRIGFSWQPFGTNGNTVVRGGWGMFSDNFPMGNANGFATNLPEDPSFTSGTGSTKGLLAPAAANSLETQTTNADTALKAGFANGATLASLQAAVPGFALPNLTVADPNLPDPKYYKWDLDVQRTLWHGAALDLSYDGNHGDHLLVANAVINAFDATPFAGLPTAAPDPRFHNVTDYEGLGISNYNGMTATLNDRFAGGVLQLNYTWSHALDDLFSSGTSGAAVGFPNNFMQEYGNSDFDYRHYFSATYVWAAPFDRWFGGPKSITSGWTVSGNMIARTGAPLSVYYNNATLTADNYNNRTSVLANYLGGVTPGSCNSPDTPCFTAAEFSKATSGFSTSQGRAMFRGPGFWDENLSLIKKTPVPGWEGGTLEFGINGFNLFNHPNFASPGVALTSVSSFGLLQNAQTVSSSPLGSNGADTSVRVFQFQLGLRW